MQSSLQLEDFRVTSLSLETVFWEPPGDEWDYIHTPAVEIAIDVLTADDPSSTESKHALVRRTSELLPAGAAMHAYRVMLVPIEITINADDRDRERDGYSLSLRVEGHFRVEAVIDHDTLDRLVTLNAPSILYGMARTVVFQTLQLAGVGGVLLPSINFLDVMTQREEGTRVVRIKSASRRLPRVGLHSSSGLSVHVERIEDPELHQAK